jgi:two-component system, NarL family, response regulator LiaR
VFCQTKNIIEIKDELPLGSLGVTSLTFELFQPHSFLVHTDIFIFAFSWCSMKKLLTSVKNIFQNSQHIVLYGALMAILVFALKWLQWRYLITDNSSEIYLGLMAILFTLLGVWVATQLAKPKIQTIIVEKEVYLSQSSDLTINEAELKKLNLSTREYEVMQLLTQGHTNAEIAEKLFLSISTIKTHVSNLFIKMDVKNRTQAIEKANRLKIKS